jgi:LysR family transcriptional regulator, transcriptional activator of nhaA
MGFSLLVEMYLRVRKGACSSPATALMEVCSSGGRGFTVVHTVVDRAALKHYGLRVIAKVRECGSDFYAITAERRVKHPGAMAITQHAYAHLFGRE